MKTFAIAGFVVLAAGAAAWAQSGGQMAVPAGPDKQTYDVPAGAKDQQILIQIRSLQDGESVTPHIHHGVEMTEVVEGTFELPNVLSLVREFDHADPRHDPRRANGAGTDAHFDCIGAMLDQIERGLGRHDIAADHLDIRIFRLYPRYRVQHAA